MRVCTIINDKGRAFNVKRVDPGEKYGLDQSLVAEDTLVDFYDASYSNAGPLGQFVSRYYLQTLEVRHGKGEGLNLHGGVPVWMIDGPAMTEAMRVMRQRT